MRSLNCRAVCRNSVLKRTDPAFSLNGLQTNGADAAIKLPLEIVHVVEGDKSNSGDQRRKRVPIFLLSSGRQRTEGATVKRILQGQQAPLGFVSVIVLGARVGSRHLERAFPCFGSAVTEKCLVQAGDLGQPSRKFSLELMEKKIRYVDQTSRLAFQRRLNHGMSVTQRVDPDPAEEIEIALASRVPEIDATSPLKQNALAVIGRQQQFRFGTNDGSQAHATVTSVPP